MGGGDARDAPYLSPISFIFVPDSVADPGFPKEATNPPVGGANLITNLSQTA